MNSNVTRNNRTSAPHRNNIDGSTASEDVQLYLHNNEECEITSQLRIILLVLFLNTFATVIAMPQYPQILMKDMQLSSQTYGLLIGANAFCHLVAAVIYGKASDYFGRRPLVLWQSFLGVFIYSSIARTLSKGLISSKINLQQTEPVLSPSAFRVLAILFISIGLTNVLGTLCNSSVCDLLPNAEERSEWLAKVGGVSGLSLAIAPFVGQVVIASIKSFTPHAIPSGNSAQLELWLAAFLFAVSFVVGYLYLPETFPPTQRGKCQESKVIHSALNWLLSRLQIDSYRNIDPSRTDELRRPLLGNPQSYRLPSEEDNLSLYAILVHPTSDKTFAWRESTDDSQTSRGNFLDESECLPAHVGLDSPTGSEVVKTTEKEAPSFKVLSISTVVILVSQFCISLSLASLNMSYALLINYLVPDSWGIPSSVLIGIVMTCAGSVYVLVQMVLYSTALDIAGSPSKLFIIGCCMMAIGELLVYKTTACLQPLINTIAFFDFRSAASMALYVILFTLHFVSLCCVFYGGSAAAEPTIVTLMSLQTRKYADVNQGYTQGLLTASRYAAIVIGPPACGWLLGLHSLSFNANSGDTEAVEGVNSQSPYVISYASTYLSTLPNFAFNFYSGAVLALVPVIFFKVLLKISPKTHEPRRRLSSADTTHRGL